MKVPSVPSPNGCLSWSQKQPKRAKPLYFLSRKFGKEQTSGFHQFPSAPRDFAALQTRF
jgi:hypothetical protein